MGKEKQMSSSLITYIILAMSGGAMDAYSYLCRDHVFANGQTGNLVLLSTYLAEGEFSMALRYVWPVLAFVFGVALSDLIQRKQPIKVIHWRQAVVFIEMVIFLGVCQLPEGYSNVANPLISLACGMQVEAFRSLLGNAIATTMCVGSLRSGTNQLSQYFATGEKRYLKSSMVYFFIIFCFMIGVVLEGMMIKIWGLKALYFSIGLLLIAFVLMLMKAEE